MVQGTTSDAGKSTLVAGLGRLLARQSIRVAPFKPQNMALNSAVTVDGGEIGRAQAVQAQACGIAATTDMNPILLKPNSDTGAQVIVHGRALANMEAAQYHDYKTIAMQAVMQSWHRLCKHYDCILVEGAGSPAEINLRDRDIANMGFAEAADCPVILIADIDKGGVFAHLVGTLALLSKSERARIKGFVINRFRGDIRLLQSGLDWLERETGKPVLGVLPYLHGFHLEAEDAIEPQQVTGQVALRICVPVLPRISNHTDFDPLRLHPQVDLQFVRPDMVPTDCDLIILPGSKSVRQDLAYLLEQGWRETIQRHLRYGGRLLGVCGGFQMLGMAIHDPDGIEGEAGSSRGLEYLDCETSLRPAKSLNSVAGRLLPNDVPIQGYEIHAGLTSGAALQMPFAMISTVVAAATSNNKNVEASIKHATETEAMRPDGARSSDDQVRGTYLHGLFESAEALQALVRWAGMQQVAEPFDYNAIREGEIERLADTLEAHLDMQKLDELIGGLIRQAEQGSGQSSGKGAEKRTG